MPTEPDIDYEILYRLFRETSKLVHSSQTVDEIFHRIVWKATEVLGAKGALLRIRSNDTKEFEIAAAYGLNDFYLSKGPVSTDSILADVEAADKVLVIDDIWNAPRVGYPQEAWDEGVRMILDVPLAMELDIVGLLRIFLTERRQFSEEEKNFLVYVAEQCACAVNKMRLIETQRARYDQLALRTEKLAALGRMAAGIAHEINNPLAGILLCSSNMIKKVDDGRLKEGLDIIIRESTRCKTIIQDLLEFSKGEEPQKRPVDINTIIEKSLNLLENEFRLKRIQIKKRLSHKLKETLLDENQFEQVFINLLLNAVHAVDENGRISVVSRMTAPPEHLEVRILDNGCGIDESHLHKIFDPFFSTKKNGTGLGLAVSYGIVQNHHGDLKVSSKPGKGAEFTITLPIHRAASTEPSETR